MTPLHATEVPDSLARLIDTAHDLRMTVAMQAAKQWRAESGGLLVLSGPVGTGKSLAAVWALWDWRVATARRDPWGKLRYLHDGRMWVAAPHLARMKGWGEDIEQVERVGFLVIDDLGEEDATEKTLTRIGNVTTARFAHGLHTVITTNLNAPTFRARYGDRLIDRLRDCGLDSDGKARWWVKCDGESLRGTPKPRPIPQDTVSEPEPEDRDPLTGEELEQQASDFLRSIQ